MAMRAPKAANERIEHRPSRKERRGDLPPTPLPSLAMPISTASSTFLPTKRLSESRSWSSKLG